MRNPLRRFKLEKKVDVAILDANVGSAILKRADEIDAEKLIYTPMDSKEKSDPYVGVKPTILTIYPDILPIPKVWKLLWIRRRWRMRLHFKRFGEPFTRDLYSGIILDSEKKRKVLIEKGFLDKEGFLLDVDGKRVAIDEQEIEINGEKVMERVCVKVDVSDIDYIKAETKAGADSDMVVKTTVAMSKTGLKFDRNFYLLIAFFGLMMLGVVFIMSGGLGSIGL